MADRLISPRRMTGPELSDLLTQHWDVMRETRRAAERTDRVIRNDDPFVLPETVVKAMGSAADQYIAQIPHPQTVPQRMLQKVIARRPHLGVPLGPKGLGITAQRLTTKVEEPLNAIFTDRKAGFKWEEMAALILLHGWGASITVTDPADWLKRASPWEDDETREWHRDFARDAQGRREDEDGYAGADDNRSANAYKLALDVHRARNVPIRHRAVGIHHAAPMFGPDLSVEGLIISQEFSTSYLRRKYRFGEAGLATPTGGNGQDSTGTSTNPTGGTMTLIEAWLIDEDNLPYVSYCVKGQTGAIETRWKGGEHDGEIATIDLKKQFNLDRLPIDWGWGLGNPAEKKPDWRARGFLEPFIGGWRSVRAKMTSNNIAVALFGAPILITERAMGSGSASIDDADPSLPDIAPFMITALAPGETLKQLEIRTIDDPTFRQMDLELGAIESESPGKSNKDQSGFSQSMAEAFEELSITTVHETLGALAEAHGSFTLEAGKRLPEMRRTRGHKGSGYAPIMVFKSTDVPLSDKAGGDNHNEPMELDPDLIDPMFTCVARYSKSMSIPEKQQSMEEVERNLKTRRKHLEDSGDEHPEETELELMLEGIRGSEIFQAHAMKLMAQVQGAEELAELAKARDEGLANEAGMLTGKAQGVAPLPPPGAPPMLPPPTMPGVPADGSVTGMGDRSYGAQALAGTVGGGTMAGPIANVVQAGGALPPDLPTPGGMV